MSRDITCSVCEIKYHTRDYSLPFMCDNCKVTAERDRLQDILSRIDVLVKAECKEARAAEKEAEDQCERYKAEVSNTLRLMNIVADERDKYKLALQQVVEKSKVETWAWVIAEEALGDED